MATHELHSSPETCHWGYFDSQLKPALRIKSGDVATIHCLSGSKEILPNKPPLNILPEHLEVVSKLTPHLGRHILTGPVYVEGAERGDALAVEVLGIKFRTNWGWNAQRPLAGTLPEDFPFYRLTHIPIDSNRGVATLPWGKEIELRPFFGIMGVAPPPEWGQCSSIEPRAFGGLVTVHVAVDAPAHVERVHLLHRHVVGVRPLCALILDLPMTGLTGDAGVDGLPHAATRRDVDRVLGLPKADDERRGRRVVLDDGVQILVEHGPQTRAVARRGPRGRRCRLSRRRARHARHRHDNCRQHPSSTSVHRSPR